MFPEVYIVCWLRLLYASRIEGTSRLVWLVDCASGTSVGILCFLHDSALAPLAIYQRCLVACHRRESTTTEV